MSFLHDTRTSEDFAYDKVPKYQFAIYSQRGRVPTWELESSAADEWQARQFFQQYQTWGIPDMTYLLVDWAEQQPLAIYRAKEAAQ